MTTPSKLEAARAAIAAHTPGPWEVSESPSWPFDININGVDGCSIVSMRRHCYSTADKTLSDVMGAVHFGHKDRQAAIEANAVQIADARLIAAAPELLEAAQMGVLWLTAALNCSLWVWDGDQRKAAEVELAKMNAAIGKALEA